jgi:hypothetical protein
MQTLNCWRERRKRNTEEEKKIDDIKKEEGDTGKAEKQRTKAAVVLSSRFQNCRPHSALTPIKNTSHNVPTAKSSYWSVRMSHPQNGTRKTRMDEKD